MNASIRNITLASGLTLVSLLGLSTTVQAQLTGSTNLKVTISQDCKITSVPGGLDQSVANYAALGANTTLTSLLTVSCNGNNFFVDAKSERNGALKTAIGSTGPSIPYTVVATDDDMGATYLAEGGLTTADKRIITRTGYDSTCASVAGCSANFKWTLTDPGVGLPVGVYQDTITYTLSAN